jgi:hypothetical protein
MNTPIELNCAWLHDIMNGMYIVWLLVYGDNLSTFLVKWKIGTPCVSSHTCILVYRGLGIPEYHIAVHYTEIVILSLSLNQLIH